MNFTFKMLFLFFVLISCSQISCQDVKNSNEVEKMTFHKVETHLYDSLTIPSFFRSLIENHTKDFSLIDRSDFNEFCSINEISVVDPSNIEKYYTIKILHDIFTSETAYDCSIGEILNIPYQWHWIQPNPRHEIYFVSNNILLKDTKPPQEFSRYNSYADIDRTPYLFLSDLVSPEIKYYSSSCDTFPTFGWCSEREMAFISLTSLLNFKGKVIAEGVHSWSEFIIPMISVTGELVNFIVDVDNTFNSINWAEFENDEIEEWEDYQGTGKLAKWYNQKAHSQTELQRIQNHLVPHKASARIENRLVRYLEIKIYEH